MISFIAEDLPHFPVTESLLAATRQRVNLAREVDQLELRMRKTNSEIGWYEKSMREMDIVLDEREMYVYRFCYRFFMYYIIKFHLSSICVGLKKWIKPLLLSKNRF